jgi:hypothetical protein
VCGGVLQKNECSTSKSNKTCFTVVAVVGDGVVLNNRRSVGCAMSVSAAYCKKMSDPRQKATKFVLPLLLLATAWW